MANWRKTKKAYRCIYQYESGPFLVTDDPYPIYNTEEYCKLGKYDFTWCDRINCDYTICSKCKSFKGSVAMNRKTREVKKRIRKEEQFWNHCARAGKQHGLTADEYFDKFYSNHELNF
ncbi:hypothetical protein [uncultured Methanobrevibacter sp.]|uniref:hypothetical protein n=1 Tax=uncultured Methanobrevibacter sp. TaxID=253161 RepID=UPI0025E30F22|nr:hypothetical protein [uncultured Methanobrevibacter sp.]